MCERIGGEAKLRLREHTAEIEQVHMRIVEARADKLAVKVDALSIGIGPVRVPRRTDERKHAVSDDEAVRRALIRCKDAGIFIAGDHRILL